MLNKLYNDEFGFVISAELVLVLTIAVLAMVVGLTAVRDAVTNELNDISHAFGAVSQTYSVVGLAKIRNECSVPHAKINGFGFADRQDDCDCKKIELIEADVKYDSSRTGKPE